VLKEGDVTRRSQSLAYGGAGFVNHFQDGPKGLEGVSGGGSGSVSELLQVSRGGKVNGLG